MGRALETLDDAPPLSPGLELRYVTAAVAITAALWHFASAAALPAAAVRTILAAVGIAAGQVTWAAWLLARPSRRCLRGGAAAAAAALLAGGALILRSGSGAITPGVVTGLSVQAVLLLLLLAGLRQRPAPTTQRAAARAGAITIAVTLSIVAAGGFHQHLTKATGSREASPSFLCHLL